MPISTSERQIIGSLMRVASWKRLAPSMRAASITSVGRLDSAPPNTTIQPPEAEKYAISANTPARPMPEITSML